MSSFFNSIKYQSLNDNNSEEFQASFVLELCKPLAAAVEVVQRIYEVVGKTGKERSRLLVKRVKSREEHVKVFPLSIYLLFVNNTHHYPLLHITVHHYASLSIITHHYPSLHITIHYYTSLSITTHHCPSLHITIHHYTSLSITTHHCPSLHITIHHYTSLSITTQHYPLLHITIHHYT